MRFFIAILFVCFVGCKPTKTNVNNHQNNAITVIQYEASARNFVLKVKVENQVLFVSRARDVKDYQEKISISATDWKDLSAFLKTVNVAQVPAMKGPTEQRYYDGAPHATVSFISGGKTYATKGFDHGYPPVELEKLVNKIVTLTEK
jgi:hypothetical protein